MLAWLSANLINIALVALIAVIIGLVIRSMIRDKRAGQSPCGGRCADCGACSACGKEIAMARRADGIPGNISE